jgi:hypothetical protein
VAVGDDLAEVVAAKQDLAQAGDGPGAAARDDDGNAIRIEQAKGWSSTEVNPMFPEAWLVRRDESLRIVSDDLWRAAHARVQQTVKSYLRRGHQLVGKVESTKGSYLLSGFLSCGLCKKPLIATRRGRNLDLVYFCREHKERGDAGCTNATGIPAIELHYAVIASLRDTFTPETFTAHLERMAGNVDAQAQRAAERAGLIADLPKLAAAEARLVKRIATVEDDALVAALKTEWQEAKITRERAERRVAELEGIERDIRGERAEVEALRETWQSWSAALQAAIDAAPGSIPAEIQLQARQILKKVLVGPIAVTPNGEKLPSVASLIASAAPEVSGRSWVFFGYAQYEKVLTGGLNTDAALVLHVGDPQEGPVDATKITFRPIAGGSGVESSTMRDSDMAPHTPQRSERPGEPVALLGHPRLHPSLRYGTPMARGATARPTKPASSATVRT